MACISSSPVLEEAFAWLCKRRAAYSPHNDVWELRKNWDCEKPRVQADLLAGEYCFEPLRELRINGEIIELWSSGDALVLKAVSIVLTEYLKPRLSGRCFHIAANGGAKGAVREAMAALLPEHHVMKSDVRGYYAGIDHMVLMDLLERHMPDKALLRLLWDWLRRTVCFGENYRDVTRGISLGCPLSPLMGALYLLPLDKAMENSGCFYARFMDDWLILAPSRWKLRRAVKTVRQVLEVLNVEIHPDKTFIGRAHHGFDFLGYALSPGVLKPASRTVEKCAERISRLYEQGADNIRVGRYIQRWNRWVTAGGFRLNTVDHNSFLAARGFALGIS